MDDLNNLEDLFTATRFRVPDYQRSYSWTQKQWADLRDDIDTLRDDKRHYTGTVVLKPTQEQPLLDDEGRQYRLFDVVDGQQRLTTLVLLLDALRRALAKLDTPTAKSLARGVQRSFLSITDVTGGETARLEFSDDSGDYFRGQVLRETPSLSDPRTPAETRIRDARAFFHADLDEAAPSNDPVAREAWLLARYDLVAHRLLFSVYRVADDDEEGVIFEVMNDRGRPLSELDKVKNHVIYSGTQIDVPEAAAGQFRQDVSRAWKHIFEALLRVDTRGRDEDELLKAYWFAAYDASAKRWRENGPSRAVKRHFSLRTFAGTDNELLAGLREFVAGLRDAAIVYADALAPADQISFSSFAHDPGARDQVIDASLTLQRCGYIIPFLPLLVAARLAYPQEARGYATLVEACEKYAFRVNRLRVRRGGNRGVGASYLAGFAGPLMRQERTPYEAADEVLAASRWYLSDNDFETGFALLDDENDWYNGWGPGLRYLLYEYERDVCGKKRPSVAWEDLRADAETTIEHVLPQTPTDPAWTAAFSGDQIRRFQHDLGNLCLTVDNSRYGKKSFEKKKGVEGQQTPCYRRGRFQTERDLADYPQWTSGEIVERRDKIVEFALRRWAIPPTIASDLGPAGPEPDEADD